MLAQNILSVRAASKSFMHDFDKEVISYHQLHMPMVNVSWSRDSVSFSYLSCVLDILADNSEQTKIQCGCSFTRSGR